MNSVCIGDMSLLTGYGDCLGFDGNGYVGLPTTQYNSGDTISTEISIGENAHYNFILDTRDSGGDAFLLRNVDEGGWHVVGLRAFVNDVEVFTGDPVSFDVWSNLRIEFINTQVVTTMFARASLSIKFLGQACNLQTKNGLYIQNGDFGDTVLVDHSGHGNDGTINGGQWWKQDIDQNFPDQLSYTSTWPIPMEESQFVIASGVDLPVRSDASWDDYNSDPTYSFTVDTGKVNTVCIGDLALLTGHDDCLKFDGVDGKLVATYPIDNDHEIELDLTYEGFTGSLGYLVRGSSNFSSGVYLYADTGGFLIYAIYSSGGTSSIYHTTKLVVGQKYLIKATTTGLNMSLTVNGTEETVTASAITYNPADAMIMGRPDNTANTKGLIHSYSIKVSGVVKDVFPSGSWGDTTLPSGTVLSGGAQWWKQGIDQNFPDATSYKSQWPMPMEISQDVIFTNPDDYIPAENVFWNPYNVDPTFSFTVRTLTEYILNSRLTLSLDLALN